MKPNTSNLEEPMDIFVTKSSTAGSLEAMLTLDSDPEDVAPIDSRRRFSKPAIDISKVLNRDSDSESETSRLRKKRHSFAKITVPKPQQHNTNLLAIPQQFELPEDSPGPPSFLQSPRGPESVLGLTPSTLTKALVTARKSTAEYMPVYRDEDTQMLVFRMPNRKSSEYRRKQLPLTIFLPRLTHSGTGAQTETCTVYINPGTTVQELSNFLQDYYPNGKLNGRIDEICVADSEGDVDDDFPPIKCENDITDMNIHHFYIGLKESHLEPPMLLHGASSEYRSKSSMKSPKSGYPIVTPEDLGLGRPDRIQIEINDGEVHNTIISSSDDDSDASPLVTPGSAHMGNLTPLYPGKIRLDSNSAGVERVLKVMDRYAAAGAHARDRTHADAADKDAAGHATSVFETLDRVNTQPVMQHSMTGNASTESSLLRGASLTMDWLTNAIMDRIKAGRVGSAPNSSPSNSNVFLGPRQFSSVSVTKDRCHKIGRTITMLIPTWLTGVSQYLPIVLVYILFGQHCTSVSAMVTFGIALIWYLMFTPILTRFVLTPLPNLLCNAVMESRFDLLTMYCYRALIYATLVCIPPSILQIYNFAILRCIFGNRISYFEEHDHSTMIATVNYYFIAMIVCRSINNVLWVIVETLLYSETVSEAAAMSNNMVRQRNWLIRNIDRLLTLLLSILIYPFGLAMVVWIDDIVVSAMVTLIVWSICSGMSHIIALYCNDYISIFYCCRTRSRQCRCLCGGIVRWRGLRDYLSLMFDNSLRRPSLHRFAHIYVFCALFISLFYYRSNESFERAMVVSLVSILWLFIPIHIAYGSRLAIAKHIASFMNSGDLSAARFIAVTNVIAIATVILIFAICSTLFSHPITTLFIGDSITDDTRQISTDISDILSIAVWITILQAVFHTIGGAVCSGLSALRRFIAVFAMAVYFLLGLAIVIFIHIFFIDNSVKERCLAVWYGMGIVSGVGVVFLWMYLWCCVDWAAVYITSHTSMPSLEPKSVSLLCSNNATQESYGAIGDGRMD